MTVDYRVANQHIKSDEYPLPLIDTILAHCSQYKVFCVLDLSEGYYNLLCHCDITKALLAFKCGDGKLYVWNVAPQGAKNTPGLFQAAMEHILFDLIDLGTIRVYLDDLVICGHDAAMALTTVAIVLTRFRKRGMRFKFSKVQFLKPDDDRAPVALGLAPVRIAANTTHSYA